MRTPVGLLAVAFGVAACAPLPPLERGLALYEAGRYFEAVSAFDEAIAEAPTSTAGWSNRGSAWIQLGEFGRAIDDFTRALELDPADAEVVFNRGNAHVLAGNFALAVEDFTRAAALRPPFSRAIYNRGIARARAGDVDGARADWRQAADVEPDPRIKAAIERRAKLGPRPAVRPPSPTTAQTLADRALTRELAGDHAGALADLRAALALETDPDRRAGLEGLLNLLEATP